jgi:hypothetical protein
VVGLLGAALQVRDNLYGPHRIASIKAAQQTSKKADMMGKSSSDIGMNNFLTAITLDIAFSIPS